LSISYAKSLLVNEIVSYFSLEKTLRLLEELFQCYFNSSFLWLSPSFILKDISARINVLCYLGKLKRIRLYIQKSLSKTKAQKSIKAKEQQYLIFPNHNRGIHFITIFTEKISIYSSPNIYRKCDQGFNNFANSLDCFLLSSTPIILIKHY